MSTRTSMDRSQKQAIRRLLRRPSRPCSELSTTIGGDDEYKHDRLGFKRCDALRGAGTHASGKMGPGAAKTSDVGVSRALALGRRARSSTGANTDLHPARG